MRAKTTLLLSACAAVLAFLSGCGGGGGQRTGRVQLRVAWPDKLPVNPARYIPQYAASLVFEFHLKSNPNVRFTTVANRPANLPSTQLVEVKALIPAGDYALAGVARVDPDGQGATVASAATSFKINAGETASVNLTLNSTISSISILDQPVTLPAGSTVTLNGQALDPNQNVVFLPGTALTWTILSGSQFATLTSTGQFHAIAPGVVRVRLQEPVVGIFADADVTVTPAVTSGLAASSNPKYQGHETNNGRGTSAGMAGVNGWRYTFGQGQGQPVIGTTGMVYAEIGDNKITALDRQTGTKLWDFVTDTPHPVAATGSNGSLYVVGQNSVWALDASTGQQQWVAQTNHNQSLSYPTILTSGIVVFGGQGGLFARSGSTGSPAWTFPTNGIPVKGCPAVGGNALYCGGDKVYSLDGGGTKLWEFAPAGETFSKGTPSLSNNGTAVYIASDSGKLYAVDANTGNKLWEQPINVTTDLAIGANGDIYVGAGTTDANIALLALDPATGNQRWASITAKIFSTPVVDSNGVIYVGAGLIFALNPTTGSTIWQMNVGTVADALCVSGDGSLYANLRFAGLLQIK